MIKITNVRDDVTKSLDGIINALSSQGRRSILYDAGREFLRITKANFGKSGFYRPEVWSPLSKKYAKKVGSNIATLLRSGELMNSIKVSTVANDSITISTNDPRAAALAFGYKPRNLPGRQYFPFEGNNPSDQVLTPIANTLMFDKIESGLFRLSNGALPLQTTVPLPQISYGNPFQ